MQHNWKNVLIVLTNGYNNFKLHMNVILDTGSSTTIIRKDMADTLSLHGIESLNSSLFTLSITIAVSHTKNVSNIFHFQISSQNNQSKSFTIKKHFGIYWLKKQNRIIDWKIINQYDQPWHNILYSNDYEFTAVLTRTDYVEFMLQQEFKVGRHRDRVTVKTRLCRILIERKNTKQKWWKICPLIIFREILASQFLWEATKAWS